MTLPLMRKALEDIEVSKQDETSVTEQQEDKAIVMTGPLGQVYTQALAIAYAKPDPVTDENNVEVAAMESQANDAIMNANVIKAISDTDATVDLNNPEALIYGVSSVKVEPNTITEVATKMAEYELGQPEEFIVVIDGTDMANDPTNTEGSIEYMTQPVNDANLTKSELVPVLESMVVRMGGRVVYSLKQAMECIAQLRAMEEVEIEKVDIEAVAAIVEEQTTNTEVVEPVVEPVVDPVGDVPTTVEVEVTETVVEPVVQPASAEPIVDAIVETSSPIIELSGGGVPDEIINPEPVVEPVVEPEVQAVVDAVVEPALESDKGKKKDEKPAKKEAPASKLNRAKNLISAVIPKIKENALRAELHHAIGIILSAAKDIK